MQHSEGEGAKKRLTFVCKKWVLVQYKAVQNDLGDLLVRLCEHLKKKSGYIMLCVCHRQRTFQETTFGPEC